MDGDKAELESYIERSGHEPEAETEFSVLGQQVWDDETNLMRNEVRVQILTVISMIS